MSNKNQNKTNQSNDQLRPKHEILKQVRFESPPSDPAYASTPARDIDIGSYYQLDPALASELLVALDRLPWSTQPRPYVRGDGYCVGATQDRYRAKISEPRGEQLPACKVLLPWVSTFIGALFSSTGTPCRSRVLTSIMLVPPSSY